MNNNIGYMPVIRTYEENQRAIDDYNIKCKVDYIIRTYGLESPEAIAICEKYGL